MTSLIPTSVPAILALADGTIFRGRSIGANEQTTAEVVFNTAITGYQEILTDPSYCGQFVTLTYPHIGNVGVNREDVESRKVWASGLIVRDLSAVVSNFRSEQTLDAYLREAPTSIRECSRESCAIRAHKTVVFKRV
jgi:carbamoyl-phosphate synthase small subunit